MTVLLGEGHAGRTYELAGDGAFGDLAAVVAEVTGEPMTYEDLSAAAYKARLQAQGAPEAVADLLTDIDAGTALGALFDDGRSLSTLIGRPTLPMAQTVAQFLRNAASPA